MSVYEGILRTWVQRCRSTYGIFLRSVLRGGTLLPRKVETPPTIVRFSDAIPEAILRPALQFNATDSWSLVCLPRGAKAFWRSGQPPDGSHTTYAGCRNYRVLWRPADRAGGIYCHCRPCGQRRNGHRVFPATCAAWYMAHQESWGVGVAVLFCIPLYRFTRRRCLERPQRIKRQKALASDHYGGEPAGGARELEQRARLEPDGDADRRARTVERLAGIAQANVVDLWTQIQVGKHAKVHAATDAERELVGGAKSSGSQMRPASQGLHEGVDSQGVAKNQPRPKQIR